MAAVAIRRSQSSQSKQLTPEEELRRQEEDIIYKQRNNLNRLLDFIDKDIRNSLNNDINYNQLGNDYVAKYNYIENLVNTRKHESILRDLQNFIGKRQLRQETLDNILNSPQYQNASLEQKTDMLYRIYPSPLARMKTRFSSGGKKKRTKRNRVRKTKKNKKTKRRY